ncbi:uncharacterized protein F5891DRAFT_1198229 [Suillus fuscotomentosus]|uniref:Uncharacterized protein n=1 Tax=Suillus fuscotomentosus TaxID=1912939 RepID=A0AAD4DS38_9AGAM|nr:uncharacterized protein F5891DRAFT_1198229 [Suillus fuscotomentosus]KAG1890424.1 hypothetical protein F5891DRAFT_1198229 [Suillus fuscotomentosus]
MADITYLPLPLVTPHFTHCHCRQGQHTNTWAMDITSLFAAMQQHDQLATMSFLNLTTFLRCTSLLKDDILQPQPHTVSVLVAPNILPPSINKFLAERVNISEDAVDVL